jgi:hypothetical protein
MSTNYEAPHCAVLSILLLYFILSGSNIFLKTVFSNTLSLCSSLYVRYHVSDPYKTTGGILVLHTFLDSRQEDKRLYQMVASIPEFQLDVL